MDAYLDAIATRIDDTVDRTKLGVVGARLEPFAEALAGYVAGAIAADIARRIGGAGEAALARLAASVRVTRPPYCVDGMLDDHPVVAARYRLKQWLRAARQVLRRLVTALCALPGGLAALRAASEDDLVAERVAMRLERGTFAVTPRPIAAVPVDNYCWMRIR